MVNRKALVVGIENYGENSLCGGSEEIDQIAELLEKNEDGSKNFDVEKRRNVLTKKDLRSQIRKCFDGNFEMALFYFSGHGYIDSQGGYLVAPDFNRDDPGVSLQDVLNIANQSRCLNRVIILDCCHAGFMGSLSTSGQNTSVINEGVTIMTSCTGDQDVSILDGCSVFSQFLIDALSGASADLTGHITIGGIYAFIDKALGLWGQRPVFKTNITQFSPLRVVKPQVDLNIIRKLSTYFEEPFEEFSLDPSFEMTNSPDDIHEVVEPYANQKNVSVFKDLQRLESIGLVRPVDEEHMYFAAMKSKACKLTSMGRQYWSLAKKGRI